MISARQIVFVAPLLLAAPSVAGTHLEKMNFPISFDKDFAVITEESQRFIVDAVSTLRKLSIDSIEIVGHADRAEFNVDRLSRSGRPLCVTNSGVKACLEPCA